MTNANDARRAHELLDELDARAELSQEQEKLLRSFLPELPKQKTLAEITSDVYIAWYDTIGSDWDKESYGDLDAWLHELHTHLIEIGDTPAAEPAKPAHPEFLETEADYQNAPEGTIVACEDSPPWHKFDSAWLSTAAYEGNNAKNMTGVIREVLRWGDGE